MYKVEAPIIVVTPVYEDRVASTKLFKELVSIFGKDVYIVAVEDGSTKEPLRKADINTENLKGVIVNLKRNVGHQRAIAIGLGYVKQTIELRESQRVVVLDSDGEDKPDSIPELINSFDNDTDVVLAHRKSRYETIKFKLFYSFYKVLFHALTGRRISFGNFMALNVAALNRLVSMQESSIHVASSVLASKLRIKLIPIDRGPRYAGQSKMNFIGLTLHGLKALMIFAEDVLVRVGVICALIATFSVLGGMTAIVLKIIGFSTPGWFSVALGILVLMFLQTGTLTFMTLMMTGVVKNGTVISDINYDEFIENTVQIG